MIGTLGDIVFEASTERVFTFRGLSRSGAPRIEEHSVIGRKPQLEFIGPGLQQVSFSIRLDRFHGVAPEQEMEKLSRLMTGGEILPLIIGGKYWGRWVILGLEEAHARHDGKGRLIVAELSIALREVAD